MKLALARAISAAVACLLVHNYGVDGAPSLRAGQKVEDSERKLNGYRPYNQYGNYNQHGVYGPGHINYNPPPPGYHPNPYMNRYQAKPYGPYGYPVYSVPTERPTPVPTPRPTPKPTPIPTIHPTPSPTNGPTEKPTENPTPFPTPSPTKKPTPKPTPQPTPSPTRFPTKNPTPIPTPQPTPSPTAPPTKRPTPSPTASPSASPTIISEEPSENPTDTDEPSENPTDTDEPSESPTETDEPSEMPSEFPTTISTGIPPGFFLTVAEVICNPANRERFLGFCVVIQVTGIDYVLNNFRDLNDEFNLLDDIDGLIQILIDQDLQNMVDLFDPFFFNARRLKDGKESDMVVPSENSQRRLQTDIRGNIDQEQFVAAFVDKYYDVEVRGDFDTFMSFFRVSAANDKLFTVFVPSNDAMDELNFRLQGSTSEERLDILTRFAQYHIHLGFRALYFNDLQCPNPNPNEIEMWDGVRTRTECENGRKFQVGVGNGITFRPEINQFLRDTGASNGLLQVVNFVVIEPEGVTI